MKTLRVIFTEAGYQPVLEQRLLGGVPRPVTLFLKLGSSLQARVLQSHWVFWRLTALNRRGLDLPKHTKSKQQLVLEIEPWLSGDDENPLTEDLCQQTRLRMMERYTYIIYIYIIKLNRRIHNWCDWILLRAWHSLRHFDHSPWPSGHSYPASRTPATQICETWWKSKNATSSLMNAMLLLSTTLNTACTSKS